MESTVVTPGPGQTVVTTEDDRGRDYRHAYGDAYDSKAWERATLREQAANFRSAVGSRELHAAVMSADFERVLTAIKDTRFDLSQIAARDAAATALASARTNELMAAGFACTNAHIAEIGKEAALAARDQLLATHKMGSKLHARMNALEIDRLRDRNTYAVAAYDTICNRTVPATSPLY